MNRLVLAVVVLMGCKGSGVAVDNVTTPSASNLAPMPSVTDPIASSSVAPSATPAPSVSATPTATAAEKKCSCPNVQVGGIYPQRSGHSSPLPASEGHTVISIDTTTCTVNMRDAFGNKSVEPCGSQLFAPPRSNPAG